MMSVKLIEFLALRMHTHKLLTFLDHFQAETAENSQGIASVDSDSGSADVAAIVAVGECTYVCMHACMYVYMYVCMHVCILYVCMYVCLYVCRYVHGATEYKKLPVSWVAPVLRTENLRN
jgi:hypothetical protein